MSLYLGNALYDTNSGTLFRDLGLIDKEEKKDRETRMPSIVNVSQNIPQADKTMNLWYNYKRSGAEKYANPFPENSRPLQWERDGRNLFMLDTLQANQKPNFPDVVTPYRMKVIGTY